MPEYLAVLEKEKGSDAQTIMKAALTPELVERFCKGWEKWYTSQSLKKPEEPAL